MTYIEDVKAGKFTAKFTNGEDAKRFYDRLVANPASDHVEPDSIRLNRKGGRLVSWQANERAFGDQRRNDGQEGIFQYWMDMAETVGYYGSSFGEPPTGAGRYTAYLNGMPGPASM
jgi:hypothetical protein